MPHVRGRWRSAMWTVCSETPVVRAPLGVTSVVAVLFKLELTRNGHSVLASECSGSRVKGVNASLPISHVVPMCASFLGQDHFSRERNLKPFEGNGPGYFLCAQRLLKEVESVCLCVHKFPIWRSEPGLIRAEWTKYPNLNI